MYNHIYFLHNDYENGIIQSQVYDMLRLIKERNDILIVIFAKKNADFSTARKIINEYGLLENTVFVNKNFYNYIVGKDRKKLSELIKSKVNVNKNTIIHCRGHLATFIAIKCKKILDINKCKIIYDIRGLSLEENKEKGFKNYVKKSIISIIINYCKKNADTYSFVTNNLRDYCIEKHKYLKETEYVIIPTCVNEENIPINKSKTNQKKIKFVYCGSVYESQQVKEIVELFIKLNNISDDFEFLFLVNDVKYVKKLTDRLKNVEIRSVSNKEVFKELSRCDVGILFRNNNIENKVSAPTKLAEYICSNLKVIYSGDIGSLKDFTTNNNLNNNTIYKIENMKDIDVNDIIRFLHKESNNSQVSDYFYWSSHINKYEKIASTYHKV